MFGYVLPAQDKLSGEEKQRFQAVYCGLCHALGRHYGFAGRLILNYDFTFLALLLQEGKCSCCEKRCIVHPLRPRPCHCDDPALTAAAGMSVVLTWWQLRDGIADHGLLKGLKYRAAALVLRGAYRRARLDQPAFDAHTRQCLQELSALEKAGEPSLDRPADAFARLLAGCAAGVKNAQKRRILETMFYHLGRWIYLVDAADDMKRDAVEGNYNPIPLRYGLMNGAWTQEARDALASTLDSSVRTMAAAFELWDFAENGPILRAVVYQGLYAVGNSVLSGTFHRGKREKKTDERGICR